MNTKQITAITYHSEKEVGYQWKLRTTDDFSTMTIHFETKKLAEQYVILNMLYYGKIL